MKEYIPVNIPLLDGNEKKYLNECIDSGWISSEGPFVERFETEFAKSVGRKHAVSVCNGTAAIDAVIEALEIGPGDEVIVPAFTIISCLNQIVRNGAIPVLVDCDINSWNMDVTAIEEKINNRTKAIMIVHIYGLPVDIDPVITLAKKYNLLIIEDAAQMHGQTYNGKPCGSFGDISTFSFYPNKHITTGEGGMIVTNSDSLAQKCKSLRNLCFLPEKRFVHERLGWNLRMSNIQAAIGLAQLEKLQITVAHKKYVGKRYNEAFKSFECINLPIEKTKYSENIYWIFGIVMAEAIDCDANQMSTSLAQSGVGTRPFFCPMNLQPIFNKMKLFNNVRCPNAEAVYKKGFYIPSGSGITDFQIDRVIDAVTNKLKCF